MFEIANEFRFPDLGEGIHEGTIVKWHVHEGDEVKADQVLAEVETDKAVVEIPSPHSGTVLKINFQEGQIVKVGEVLVMIGTPGESAGAKPQGLAQAAPAASGGRQPLPPPARTVMGHHLATPATRKLARELGVDIEKVQGTGPGGRVTDYDVNRAALPKPSPQTTLAEHKPSLASAPEPGDERIPLTHMRKVIAERMVYSKTHIPHACGMDYVDVTRLSEIREKEKKSFAPRGVKLTYLPFIVKAVTIALREMPRFNAQFDEEAGELIIKKRHNIGIAVDTPEGLMVPVIKDVESKSIIEIAMEIERLAAGARDRKLRLDEIRGGTFTITNVGSVGGMYSTPIINPPEVAIMGVHRIKELPLVVEGRVVSRLVMGISLCFDHRVSDGAEATQFMNVVMRHLEDPDLMLVDMI